MGHTVAKLAKRPLSTKIIFPNRFVIEICEKVHTHYKSLRFVNSMHDWIKIAEGFRDGLDRWKKRGCPTPSKNRHIELCRKEIVSESESNEIVININDNLYNSHKGTIFADGADFDEGKYIHLKIRDIRLELSIDDFKEIAGAVREAEEKLESSDILAVL